MSTHQYGVYKGHLGTSLENDMWARGTSNCVDSKMASDMTETILKDSTPFFGLFTYSAGMCQTFTLDWFHSRLQRPRHKAFKEKSSLTVLER